MLRLLDGDRAALQEPLVALVFLLRKGERGLRLHHLLVGLIDPCLLCADLRVDIGDISLRLVDLRFALIDLHLVVAFVERHQHGPGLDELVVRHRHVDHLCIDLRTDGDRAGVDEGVIGRYVSAGVNPPDHDSDKQQNANRNNRQHQRAMLAQTGEPRRIARRVARCGFRFLARRSFLATFVVDALVHDS